MLRSPLSIVLAGSWILCACTGNPPGRSRPSVAPHEGDRSPDSRAGRIVRDCAGCPRMVVIPGGTFVIGSPASEAKRKKNEGPQRAVAISTFAVSELETTRAQYALFVHETDRATPVGCQTEGEILDGEYETDLRASWRDPGYDQGDDHPVVCVDWSDAMAYADWLSRRTGHSYRLLSNSEWEFAARAGTTSAYFWGDDRDQGCVYANGCDQSLKRIMPPSWGGIYAGCDDGATRTTPGGHYRPNGFGLYDMTGNVWEWVADCTESNYESLPTNGRPIDRAGCAARDVRGGSWDDDPEDLRNASRHHVPPTWRSYDLGFRVARSWP